VATLLREHSAGRWAVAEAQALQALAQRSTASTRAVVARSLVVRTLALHLLDLQERLNELEQALAALLDEDEGSEPMPGVPGLGPVTMPTIRAELGEVSRFRGVDQVIAYAGLEPRTRQSGAWMGQKRLVLSRTRRAAPCPLLGSSRGGALPGRMARALPAVAGAGSGEEGGTDHPLPLAPEDHLSSAAHRDAL
jgi:hypothetical protein